MHIFFLYFVATLRISCRFSLIKAHKLCYFYRLLYSRDNRCAAKSLQFQRLHPASIFGLFMLSIHCIPNKFFCVYCRIISFDVCHSVAFYHPEISNFRPCSPSLEDAILDSELENVGPTLSSLVCPEANA